MNGTLTYTVFTDFDGTVAVRDVGDAMFERFGDVPACAAAFDAYRRGEIDARQCWERGFATMRPVSRGEFLRFTEEHRVDAAFPAFAEYCAGLGIPVTVLSDGFDAYIGPILERTGFSSLPRYSNELEFRPDGTAAPRFPYTDAECRRCANCKRNHLLTRSHDGQVVVYIGDGVSDRCPAQYADIVFAKDALVPFCETHNITFHRFGTFADVLARFRTIVETERPRKRRTAELARKDIFIGE